MAPLYRAIRVDRDQRLLLGQDQSDRFGVIDVLRDRAVSNAAHHLVHLRQEHLTTRPLLLPRVLRVAKTHLAHASIRANRCPRFQQRSRDLFRPSLASHPADDTRPGTVGARRTRRPTILRPVAVGREAPARWGGGESSGARGRTRHAAEQSSQIHLGLAATRLGTGGGEGRNVLVAKAQPLATAIRRLTLA